MENTKPRITEKQLNYISLLIWKKEDEESLEPFFNKIQRRVIKDEKGEVQCEMYRSDFEIFIRDNFNIEEASLFIQKIGERDPKGLIEILKNKNYNFIN